MSVAEALRVLAGHSPDAGPDTVHDLIEVLEDGGFPDLAASARMELGIAGKGGVG